MDILFVKLGTLPGDVLSMHLEKEIKGSKKDTQVVRVSSRARKSIWLGYFVVAHLIYRSHDQFANYFRKEGPGSGEFVPFINIL